MTRSSGPPRALHASVVIVFLNRYAVLIISLISTMIVARLVTPTDTGMFSVAASIVLLAQTVRDFGIAEYLVQEKHLTRMKIRTAFGLTLCLAWGLGLVVLLARHSIAAIYGTPQLADLIAIVSGSFFVAPFSSTVLALLNRDMAFGILFRISIASALANAIVSVVLASWGWGAMALTCGMLAMNVTTAAVAALSAGNRDHFIPSLREWRDIVSFGINISAANIMNQMAARGPDLIVGRLLGYPPLGLYNRANGVVAIFNDMVVAGIQTVAFPAFSEAHRNGRSVVEAYLRLASLVTGAALPLLVLVAIIAQPLVFCLLGPAWIDAAALIPFLAAGNALILLAPMASAFLSATGWVRLVPRIAICMQLPQIALIAFAATISITAVAISFVAYGFISFLVSATFIRRAAGIGFVQLLRASLRSAAVAALTGILPFVVLIFLPAGSPWFVLIATGICGGLSWCAAVILVRHPIVGEIRVMLRQTTRAVPRRV